MTSRRALLQRLAALGMIGAMAAGIALPEGAADRATWRRRLLREAWKRAAASGRPLLVVVIPEEQSVRWIVSDVWGEVISHGSDEALSALAAGELVCATQAELAELLPSYLAEQPEPTLVRLDVGVLPVRQTSAQFILPEPRREIDGSGRLDERRLEALITARIEAMEAVIFSVVQPTAASRGADLAARRTDPIPGSRWMRSTGCGASFETPDPLVPDELDQSMMIGCGMGHTSERSARFLDFLTEEPGER